MKSLWVWLGIFLLTAAIASAEKITVKVHLVSPDGVGKEIGTIDAEDKDKGVLFTPNLSGLPPGAHGFHAHENPSCTPAEKDGKMTAAQSAGAHLDPGKTGKHLGPIAEGHLGDLPILTVDANGKATTPVLAHRLKVADLKGRSLMIHAGSDNFSDTPQPLGGGGGRIACGVVQ